MKRFFDFGGDDQWSVLINLNQKVSEDGWYSSFPEILVAFTAAKRMMRNGVGQSPGTSS